MDYATFQISAAGLMVFIAIGLVVVFRRHLAHESERRMMDMLQLVGVDPAVARQAGAETLMQEVRARCRQCQAEGVCERWLDGEVTGENSFCPNAPIFDQLAKTRK